MNNVAYCSKCDREHGVLFDCTIPLEYKMTVEGNCGKIHTIEEWQQCIKCNPTEKQPNSYFNTEAINEGIAELNCHKFEKTKGYQDALKEGMEAVQKSVDSVGISAEDEMKRACADPDYYNKQIWNAAIEAAALSVHTSKGYPTQYSDTIRKLNK